MADVPIAYNSYRDCEALKIDALMCPRCDTTGSRETINSGQQIKYNTYYAICQEKVSNSFSLQ